MSKICVMLAPMRNGTSVLMYALANHPEIFQLAGLVEHTSKKSTEWDHIQYGNRVELLADMYIPLMETIAGKAVENQKTEGNLAQHKLQNLVVIDRTHIPIGELFWSRLAKTDFCIMSIFRHPAEVALSYLSWQEKFGVNPVELMAKWVDAVNAYHFLKETNDTLLLKHEHICKEPAFWGRKIHDWLGIAPDEEFASYYKPASQKRHQDDRWKSLVNEEVIRASESIGYAL